MLSKRSRPRGSRREQIGLAKVWVETRKTSRGAVETILVDVEQDEALERRPSSTISFRGRHFEENRRHRGNLDDEDGRIGQAAHHRFQINVMGAV